MSPNARRLWEFLPTDVWMDRDKVGRDFGVHYQLAITHLFYAGLIDLKFKDKDDAGLMYASPKQFIRKKTIEEIRIFYSQVVDRKSPHFSSLIFKEMMVKCKLKKRSKNKKGSKRSQFRLHKSQILKTQHNLGL